LGLGICQKGEHMRNVSACITWLTVASLATVLSCTHPRPAPAPPPAPAVGLVSGEEAGQLVTVRDVKVSRDGTVSATLVNHSNRPLRDIRVLVRHSWLWKNERKPGDKNPSRAIYHVVPDLIAPGGEATFSYRPAPPLPARRDGHFVTAVDVVGYS